MKRTPSRRLDTLYPFLGCLLLACADDGQGAHEDAHTQLDAASSVTDEASVDASQSTQQDAATVEPWDAAGVGTIDAAMGTGTDAEAAVPVCSQVSGGDQDGDGHRVGAGDCNDCDKNVNPEAYDVPGNGLDEDCSGRADDEPQGCDQGLAMEGNSAMDAARALGLCRNQSGSSWGIKSARWVFPDGSAGSIDRDFCAPGRPPFSLSRGLLSSYGARLRPRDGASMLALSSGVARVGSMELGPELAPAFGHSPDAVVTCLPSPAPSGFPSWVAACGGTAPADLSYVQDGIALELEIKVPSNASEIAFDFDFISTEFPLFVCDGKSDQFVALLYSSHPATPANRNISFDSNGNVVSVDGAFVRVCEPITLGGRTFACPLGVGELEGTGISVRKDSDKGPYLQGGATGWLGTRAPVTPGETVKLRLAIWDSDDPFNDSTVLIDHLRFGVTAGAAPSAPAPPKVPVTEPIILL